MLRQLLRANSRSQLSNKRSITTISIDALTKVTEAPPGTPKAKIDPSLYNTREHPTGVDQPKLGELRSFKVFLQQGQQVLYCSCGHSKTPPYCEKSCLTVNQLTKQDFKPYLFEATESKIYGLCLCKYSKQPVLCDGTHKIFKGWTKPAQPFPPNPPPPLIDTSIV